MFDVILKDETIWLTQKSMAELFDVNSQAITKHLQNIYNDGELQKEGSRSVKRNLDKIKQSVENF